MALTKTGKPYANPVRRTQVTDNIVKDPWAEVEKVKPQVKDATVKDPWSKDVEWSEDTSSEKKNKKEED